MVAIWVKNILPADPLRRSFSEAREVGIFFAKKILNLA
jgi:uncharacterized protein YeaO (DUF488 family)